MAEPVSRRIRGDNGLGEMKELVVLSGKGGTGKTSLVGCFAALAENKILVDCDVDAADLHLLLEPSVRETHQFRSGRKPVINSQRCTKCGLCVEVCRFSAIHEFTVDMLTCEGCGFCAEVCPAGAITMEERTCGRWFVSDTGFGPLVHAELGIGEDNSGKLVATIRQAAHELARRESREFVISDGPPGTGCPVISSLSGASLALLVTEPTLSGFHDLERVIAVCRHFDVPVTVCLNKYDVNEDISRHIEDYCATESIPIAGCLPFDTAFTDAMSNGQSLIEYQRKGTVHAVEDLWSNVSRLLTREAKTSCHGVDL
jgi:MinD superfamily P-loop ATPase